MAISRTDNTVTDRYNLRPETVQSGLAWTPDAARCFASAEAEQMALRCSGTESSSDSLLEGRVRSELVSGNTDL
jgi:hypothetical protein